MEPTGPCTAFAGSTRISSGTPATVAPAVKALVEAADPRTILVFDDSTSYPVEFDLRGSAEDVRARYAAEGCDSLADTGSVAEEPRRGPGRPKLGVVGREVTLLPRHWEWLAAQPGGASVALRKLVEQARRENAGKDRIRAAQESAYRFMSAIAGNETGYEEATRALFAGDAERFEALTESWPADVREHARALASRAFS